MKNSKGFNLVTVIIIICVVSIVSGLTTGIIVTNTYHGISSDDKALNEFLRVYSDISNNYYEDINKEEMLDKAMDAMLDYLGDSYTTYLNKEERDALEERLSSTYRGIGVSFRNKTIEKVTLGSPANEAGLQSGDVFIKINDTDVSNLTDSQIGELIKSSEKDTIALTVLRGDEEVTSTVNIKHLDRVAYNMIEDSTIGYLSIPIFSKSIASQTSKALTALENQGMTKLIIDLRDDSGGLLEEAQNLASIFLEKDKLIFSLENKDDTKNYYDQTEEKKTYPIVVLINENSASAAEILAAALKDSYGATLVGNTTFGKGVVQQTYSMSDGSMAKYTSAKWYRPNGTCINEIGINPDYPVDIVKVTNEDGTVNILDAQLNKAIEILGHN